MLQTSDFVKKRNLPPEASLDHITRTYLERPIAVRTSLFEPKVYLGRAAEQGLSPSDEPRGTLVHWAISGFASGVSPTTQFDAPTYLTANPDVAESGMDALEHYLLFGRHEGRAPLLETQTDTDVSVRKPQDAPAPQTIPAPIVVAMPALSAAPDFYARVMAPLLAAVPDFGAREAALLVAIYDAKFAPSPLLDASASYEAHFEDFLMHGLWDNRAPSPLFDPATYAVMAAEVGLPLVASTPALLHWLAIGRSKLANPTPRFDETFYVNHYPDLQSYDGSMFDHYIRFGLWEGRKPNKFFDPGWYAARTHGEPGMPAYYHYLMHGADAGQWPSQFVAALASRSPQGFSLAAFDADNHAARQLSLALGHDAAQFAVSLFSPAPDRIGDSWDDFVAFMRATARHEEYEGVWFSPSIYRASAKALGLELADDQPAFPHFLEVGRRHRPKTTQAFDEDAYLKQYPDLSSWQAWLFEHFLTHGLFEGRRSNGLPVLALAPALTKRDTPPEATNWQDFFKRALVVSAETRSPAQRAARTLTNPVIRRQAEAALSMEPLVGSLSTFTELLAPPLHDVAGDRLRTLRKRFSTTRYDSIVCIPWLRTGGADLVACLVAASLRRIFPDDTVLLLQTDHPAIDRIEWKPQGVDLIDVSDILGSVDPQTAERLLNAALSGLSPKRIINVNSNLCWRVFRRFGKRLKDQMDLFGYLFCWDRTPEGVWAGYPSDFYAETADHLTGILTDTKYLKNQLIRIYNPPPELLDKIHPIYTPLADDPDAPSENKPRAKAAAAASARKKKKRVLWAGRLDRQKRFDLAIQVAQAMPDVEFKAWGKALLDQAPDTRNLPKNMSLLESFNSYEELNLDAADAWLFTSEWEGLPTLLIELGARGVPIVASAVGGVPELITPETGWPVDEVEDPNAYVAALRDAFAKDGRSNQGAGLKALVSERHSQSAYDQKLQTILEGRTP